MNRRLSVIAYPLVQSLRMPGQMIGHERRDEIITVVVSRLAAQRQRDAGLLRMLASSNSGRNSFSMNGSAVADIDEDFFDARAILDQRDRIVLAPRRRDRRRDSGVSAF